jgi:hypothetical protein
VLALDGVSLLEARFSRQRIIPLFVIKIYKISPIEEYLVWVYGTKDENLNQNIIAMLYNLKSVESQLTFRRNMLLPFQVRRISQARNQLESRWQVEFGFLLGLFLDPEDGGDMFL